MNRIFILCLGLVGSFLLAGQSSLAQSWTHVLDAELNSPAPAWILPQANLVSEGTLATQSYVFPAAPGKSGLLATLLFEEVEGGFLRAYWRSETDSMMLSENLYEGIGLSNQRVLRIPQKLLEGGGTLTLQAGGTQLGLRKISWDWLSPLPMLVAGDQDAALMNSLGIPLRESEVDGDPMTVPIDKWKGRVVTAQITESPLRIEQGVEFGCLLEEPPALARLEWKVNGLPLPESMMLWVNGQSVGLVRPELPDLTDPGYHKLAGSKPTYYGWRKASVLIPNSRLKSGYNAIQFSADSEDGLFPQPLAVKEIRVQLFYPDPSEMVQQAVPITTQEELVPEAELGSN
ncbi:MAG: hypothetical protein HC904_05565 [Blastochloris sp.]|nr:hypothetical protein [Blastochloris sp.]